MDGLHDRWFPPIIANDLLRRNRIRGNSRGRRRPRGPEARG
jgi:hypothetical protein